VKLEILNSLSSITHNSSIAEKLNNVKSDVDKKINEFKSNLTEIKIENLKTKLQQSLPTNPIKIILAKQLNEMPTEKIISFTNTAKIFKQSIKKLIESKIVSTSNQIPASTKAHLLKLPLAIQAAAKTLFSETSELVSYAKAAWNDPNVTGGDFASKADVGTSMSKTWSDNELSVQEKCTRFRPKRSPTKFLKLPFAT